MKTDMYKRMYMLYVSNIKKARKEHMDIPDDHITKKTRKNNK